MQLCICVLVFRSISWSGQVQDHFWQNILSGNTTSSPPCITLSEKSICGSQKSILEQNLWSKSCSPCNYASVNLFSDEYLDQVRPKIRFCKTWFSSSPMPGYELKLNIKLHICKVFVFVFYSFAQKYLILLWHKNNWEKVHYKYQKKKSQKSYSYKVKDLTNVNNFIQFHIVILHNFGLKTCFAKSLLGPDLTKIFVWKSRNMCIIAHSTSFVSEVLL